MQSAPDPSRSVRQEFPAMLDFSCGPLQLLTNILVEAYRTLGKSALDSFLFLKRAIRVCAVVTRQCQVAEAMEPGLLNCLPGIPEHLFPRPWQFVILGKNVFDCI